eukprot:gene22155-1368_t
MAKVGRRLRRQLIKAASLTVVYGQGRGGFEDKGHSLWEEEKQRARRATKRKLKRCPTDLDALVEESEESETEPAAKDANVPNNIYSASHFQGSGNVTSDSGTRLSEEEEGVGFVAGRETCMGKYVQPCRTAGKSYYDTVWFRVLLVFLLLGFVGTEVVVNLPHRKKIREQMRPAAPVHYPLAGKWADDQWHPMLCDEYSEDPIKYFTSHEVYEHTGGEAMMLACSGHKSITFVGDSRMRNLYFAFAAATDPNFDSSEQEGKTHADLSTVIPNLAIQIEFIWAPALDD